MSSAAVGSDVAGSLRIPALFCGIVSLKPTAGRLAEVESNYAQQWDDFEAQGDYQTLILPTCGPMGRTVRDVETLMKAMNSYNEVHMSLPPLPWRQVALPTKIGVIRGFNSLLEPCSAASRALDQAVASTGMTVVEIDLSDLIEEIVVNAMCCFFKDVQLIDAVKGRGRVNEPLVDAFKVSNEVVRGNLDADAANPHTFFCRSSRLWCRSPPSSFAPSLSTSCSSCRSGNSST